MVNAITVEIKGVGLVLFERSKRAKRVSISIKPLNGVRVAVPYRLSFNEAIEFVITKTDWIKKQSEKMRQYERQGYFEFTNDEKDIVKAKAMLTKRLEQLAKTNGFSFNRVFIRNQRTRWGSCSSKNNISLNIKLVNLPDDLIDYVLLHELVHTRRKDHSKAFWAEMDKLVGNGKKKALIMRKYGIGLI